MARIVLLMMIGISLGGCSIYSIVEPGTQKVGSAFQVNTGRDWSRAASRFGEVWTVDGVFLQSLRFYNSVEDGQGIFTPEKGKEQPVFKKDMADSEVVEFVADSVAASGGRDVKAHNVRLVNFGGKRGLRFDLTFRAKNGLEERGLAEGAVIRGRLYLVLYLGAKGYYYSHYVDEVENIIKSIKMNGHAA